MAERPPLSVWPTAQQPSRLQRHGRYVPDSMAHPGKMLPDVARHAIRAYTRPGDLVLDPMCGIGTTLVEAAHLGRDSVGVEYEPRWAGLAQRNLAHAAANGATGKGRVVTGDSTRLETLLDAGMQGRVAMVLTSPPYGPSTHGHVEKRPGEGVLKYDTRYSTDPANLAHRSDGDLLAGFTRILASCRPLLQPGGFVVVTARPWRRGGMLVDLPAAVTAAAEDAGLEPFERNVALLVGLREDRLVPRASFFQIEQVRKARRAGRPLRIIAHEDVLVFRKPERR